MALKALYLWQSRYNNSRAMLSFATATDGASVCMCTCAQFCMYQVYASGVCAVKKSVPRIEQQLSSSNSRTTATVFQAHAFVPADTVYVCGLSTAGDRTATATVSRPMQQSNTHLPTSYHAYKAHSSSKRSSSNISLERQCSFFST